MDSGHCTLLCPELKSEILSANLGLFVLMFYKIQKLCSFVCDVKAKWDANKSPLSHPQLVLIAHLNKPFLFNAV